MKPEALHSLSVVILVAGLFLSAVGMIGSFFFGNEVERSDGTKQLAVLQGLSERVADIQSEQAGLRDRLVGLDQRLSVTPAPTMPAPVPAIEIEKTMIASATPPPATPAVERPLQTHAQASLPKTSNGPKLPPIAQAPPKTAPKPAELPAKPASGVRSPGEKPPAQMEMVKLNVPSPKLPPTAPNKESLKPKPQAGSSKSGRPVMTDQQHDRLVRRLRAYPQHAIIIRAEAGEAHSVELAMALRAAFRDAGWEVAAVQLDSKRAPFPGLSLSSWTFPPPKEFVAAFGALEAAGFKVASNLDPHQTARRVVLSVGTRR